MIDIKISKMYGFNKTNNIIEFNSEKRTNFVYGINAIGKSSFSKAINLFITNDEYKPILKNDSEDFLLNFKFDDLNGNIKPKELININKPDEFVKRVFVFSKDYLNKNVSNINLENGVTIGFDIVSRDKKILDTNEFMETQKDIIVEKAKTKKVSLNSTDLLSTCNIKKLKSTSKDKGKERNERIEAVNSLYDINCDDISIVDKLKRDDFLEKNINSLKEIKKINIGLKDKIEKIITLFKGNKKYNITTIEDKEFYEMVVKYLKTKSVEECPICQKGDFNTKEIIENIEKDIMEIVKNEIIENYSINISKIIEKDSYFYESYSNLYMQMISGNIDISNVNNLDQELDKFIENYDYILLKYIGYEFQSTEYTQFQQDLLSIDEINRKNSELGESDKFIEIFDKLLKHVFDDISFEAKKYEYQNIGYKYYGIQLVINGEMKEGISVEDFFERVLSESQKTRISMAYMLASVLFYDYNGKILCIFDDPIDSYDSVNKYKMVRLIYEFINKKSIFSNYQYECNSIILSHSSDYFRLFNEYFSDVIDEVQYFVMNKDAIDRIDSDKLYILRGDYNILESISKEENLSIIKFISVLPIARELSDIVSKILDNNNANKFVVYNNNHNNKVRELDNYISKNLIHGFNENVQIMELYNNVSNYIDFNIETVNNNIGVYDFIENYIDNERNKFSSMNFYELTFVKNIVSMYIRGKMDFKFVNIIKNEFYITDNNWNFDKINKKFPTLKNKISKVYKNEVIRENYKELLYIGNWLNPLFNDFAHSANIFLSPLIDVQIDDLLDYYDKVNEKF